MGFQKLCRSPIPQHKLSRAPRGQHTAGRQSNHWTLDSSLILVSHTYLCLPHLPEAHTMMHSCRTRSLMHTHLPDAPCPCLTSASPLPHLPEARTLMHSCRTRSLTRCPRMASPTPPPVLMPHPSAPQNSTNPRMAPLTAHPLLQPTLTLHSLIPLQRTVPVHSPPNSSTAPSPQTRAHLASHSPPLQPLLFLLRVHPHKAPSPIPHLPLISKTSMTSRGLQPRLGMQVWLVVTALPAPSPVCCMH